MKNLNIKQVLLFAIIVLIIAYVLCECGIVKPIHNEGTLTMDILNQNLNEVDPDEVDMTQDMSMDSESINSESDMLSQEDRNLINKMLSKNSAQGRKYKHSSYDLGDRDSQFTENLDKFFNDEQPQNYNESKGFSPSVEGSGYAAYVGGSNKKLTDKEKFDSNALLPKEENKDWFDDPYETTKVKSSNLINIYRPVGVNTVQTTLKNPSWDIRGTPANPKYPVSPWMNSSYEPDINIKGNMLC